MLLDIMQNTPNIPEPFNVFMLAVGDGHEIYVEESGNPQGIPLISFHGGPGSRSKPKHRAQYDLDKFRLILFDQRNGGNSRPLAADTPSSLKTNLPSFLVSDAEKIRQKLEIEDWHVAGASWGSALALLYAIQFPNCVRSLTLRALFLARNEDWLWAADGAQIFSPLAYLELKNLFPNLNNVDLVKAVADKILNSEKSESIRAFKILANAEHGLELLSPQQPMATQSAIISSNDDLFNTALCYAHMLKNNQFHPNWCFTDQAKSSLRELDISIVHGACDIACPVKNVYALKQAHPHIKLSLAANAGHSIDLDGNYDILYRAEIERVIN